MTRAGLYDQSYPMAKLLNRKATGATAGIPGVFTPPGSTPPADVAGMTTNAIVATPATPWTSGQFVQTGTAGAAGRACWSGTGWVGGAAPLMAAEQSAEEPKDLSGATNDAPEVDKTKATRRKAATAQ